MCKCCIIKLRAANNSSSLETHTCQLTAAAGNFSFASIMEIYIQRPQPIIDCSAGVVQDDSLLLWLLSPRWSRLWDLLESPVLPHSLSSHSTSRPGNTRLVKMVKMMKMIKSCHKSYLKLDSATLSLPSSVSTVHVLCWGGQTIWREMIIIFTKK